VLWSECIKYITLFLVEYLCARNAVWECGLDSSGTGYGIVAGSCEHDNKYSSSIKVTNFLTSVECVNFAARNLHHGVRCHLQSYQKDSCKLSLTRTAQQVPLSFMTWGLILGVHEICKIVTNRGILTFNFEFNKRTIDYGAESTNILGRFTHL
jgi:hypothetical protein